MEQVVDREFLDLDLCVHGIQENIINTVMDC